MNESTSDVKMLVIKVDDKLNFKVHINTICQSTSNLNLQIKGSNEANRF